MIKSKSVIYIYFIYRLTGAGWGGCIVALVTKDNLQKYIDGIKLDYYYSLNAMTGMSENSIDTVIFPTKPGPGAQIYHI